jgi:DNA modification methylase
MSAKSHTFETPINTPIDRQSDSHLATSRIEPAIVWRDLSQLRTNPRNARTHPNKQVGQLGDIMRRFGVIQPVLVDEDGVLIAGHGRVLAARRIGLKSLPVIVVSGLSETEKRAFALADNKIAANAGWDRQILADELGDLSTLLVECNLDLAITGFEPAEIDSLLGDLVDPETDPVDETPPLQKQATSKLGDLWQLGQHRLLCGDAQSAKHVATLMGTDSAAMTFMDPPYNVKTRRIQGRGRTKHGDFIQACGEMSPLEFTKFLRRSLSNAAKRCKDGAIIFVCMDWRHMGELLAAGAANRIHLKNVVVWVKTNAGQGSFYRNQHELVFVYKAGDGANINNFGLGQHGRNRSNVWTYPGVNTFRAGRMDDLALHPTVKPVALVADAMRDCSRRGDIVLDLFMGSGTTVMAAERVGRRSFGLELDPLYVDTAIRRWQTYTKRDAILMSTGHAFDEVAGALREGTKFSDHHGRSGQP